MISIRRAKDRGHAQHGWLDSWHTFSFADYHDPAHMGIGPLRVINEDRIQPGTGFGTHPHRDMEIISYVLDGALAHRDSLGNGSIIRPGDVQRMTAGTGVRHSEHNANDSGATHFLQIWIMPHTAGLAPGYEQTHFAAAEKRGRLRLVASPDGEQGSVTIHQDARLHAGLLQGDEQATLALAAGRQAYVHVARGTVQVDGSVLEAGDAAHLTATDRIHLDDGDGAEVLVFDLPGGG
jgi:redox-sensitive bicupin YhaK (pirin superfamily)